jgi:hypothetical protein
MKAVFASSGSRISIVPFFLGGLVEAIGKLPIIAWLLSHSSAGRYAMGRRWDVRFQHSNARKLVSWS